MPSEYRTDQRATRRHAKLEVGSKVKVKFVDFWPGFDPHAFLVPLLEGPPFEFSVEVIRRGRPHIQFTSVFDSYTKRIIGKARNKCHRFMTGRTAARFVERQSSTYEPIRVWLTGENVHPPLGPWDATLSFDPDSPMNGNAYFPLWWQMFPELLGVESRGRPGIVQVSRFWPIDTYLANRSGSAGERQSFACAVISNPQPTRMRAIKALGEVGHVDVLGRVTGQPIVDKHEVFRKYRFVLCFENDAYPGYVTEKVFDAWGSGAIPLWWGIDRDSFLNPDSLLNLALFKNIDSFVHRVSELNKSQSAMNEMSSKALLLQRPNLKAVRRTLAKALLPARD